MKCKWLVGLAVLTFAACNGDSPTGPSVQDSAVSTGSVQSAAVDTTPAVSPTPEPDLSNGKGITAKFVGLDATITSTNTGHSTSGLVCYTDGFQGPTLPGTPVSWTVQAKSNVTVLFPIDAIAAELKWEEGQCDQTINVQGDVFRGDACEGYNFAVAWPQHNEVTFVNPDVGEWKLISEERSKTAWGECVPSDDNFDAEGIQQCRPSKCGRKGQYTITKTYKNPCNDETRTSVADMVEYEPCECPPPPCEEEWVEQDMVIENDNPCVECGGEHTWDEVIYEINSCTEVEREKSRVPKSEPCEECCEEISALPTAAAGLYCLDGPLGSPSSEASYFGINFNTFTTKVDNVGSTGYAFDEPHTVALFKDGTGGPCPQGEHAYYLWYQDATHGPVDPAWRAIFSPFIYQRPDGRGMTHKDISHVTIFDDVECDNVTN